MIQVQTKKYSFTEYLNYQDNSDYKYELVNGELVAMPPASGFHALILRFLFMMLENELKTRNLKYFVMPGTVGVRTATAKSRIPDLVILSEEQCQQIREMSTAVLETSPLLAIEIVSASNKEDDYRYKRSEYAAVEIPEYWIVDPIEQKVSVLFLVSGFYEVEEFRGGEKLKSDLFSELDLTVHQVFNQ